MLVSSNLIVSDCMLPPMRFVISKDNGCSSLVSCVSYLRRLEDPVKVYQKD
jgi:hypothetical protein